MKWWKVLRPRPLRTAAAGPPDLSKALPEWRIVRQRQGEHRRNFSWHDAAGDALTLTRLTDEAADWPALDDEPALWERCRAWAEADGSGLVEVALVSAADGPAVMFITKRVATGLRGPVSPVSFHGDQGAPELTFLLPGFVFTGLLLVPMLSGTTWLWTITRRDSEPSGRQLMVLLMLNGLNHQLPFDRIAATWVQDPYDPTYAGVAGFNLHSLSDDAHFDAHFPNHPLTMVRRELRQLLAVRLDALAPQGVAGAASSRERRRSCVTCGREMPPGGTACAVCHDRIGALVPSAASREAVPARSVVAGSDGCGQTEAMATPPRLMELRCTCGVAHWEIDHDSRGASGKLESYEARPYRCPGCGVRAPGFVVLQQSPSAFFLQPHPVYPMGEAEFDQWVAVVREHFPDHPRLKDLGTSWWPTLQHSVFAELQKPPLPPQ